ncbi:MAG: polyhydroxyalkanoate synthesis repressor PhaR [Parvularculaceae bacterium]
MSQTKKSAEPGVGATVGGGPGETPKRRAANERGAGEPITIKKYANRRLYNTATSSYVTLDYLSEMVKEGHDFVVFDAKTGDDITRSVLTQIIFEEENKGQNLLPIQFLRQLIQFYGNSLQNYLPSYLEMSMDAFSRNQEAIREQMRGAFGATPGYNMFEETARKNMALFEQTMKMFSPMGGGLYGQTPATGGDAAAEADDVNALKAELAELKRRLREKGE